MNTQQATHTPKITVRRQTELRSKQFGVYRDGELVEGGFFSADAAWDCAWSLRDNITFARAQGGAV